MHEFDKERAQELLDEMRKLANRLEDERLFSRLAQQNTMMEELWEEYCLLVYEDVW